VTPAIQAAGWGDSPFEIAEQRSFTYGRIVLTGRTAKRRESKRADYLLRYRRDLTLAVVEAKRSKSEIFGLVNAAPKARFSVSARCFAIEQSLLRRLRLSSDFPISARSALGTTSRM
jgi:hypothetical protein